MQQFINKLRNCVVACCVGLVGLSQAASAEQPYLAQHMPAEAMLYLNVPWVHVETGATQQDSLFAHPANRKAKAQIQQALVALAGSDDFLQQPELAEIVQQLQSGLELVLLPAPAESQVPLPNVLLTALLTYPDHASLNAALQSWAKAQQQVELYKQSAKEQDVVLKVGPLLLYGRYYPEQKRIFLMAGAAANETLFSSTVNALTHQPEHPLLAEAATTNTSRNGLLLWVDMPKALPTIRIGAGPELSDVAWQNLERIQSFTAAVGSKSGQGRITLKLVGQNPPWADWAASEGVQLNLHTSGQPHYLLTTALPSMEQIWAAAKRFPGNSEATLEKFRQWLERSYQLEPEQLLNALGPEVVVFGDDVGEFMAFKLRDRNALKAVMAVMARDDVWTYGTQRVYGQRIHHLSVPSRLFELAANQMKNTLRYDGEEADAVENAMNAAMRRFVRRWYCLEEREYLVCALTPQQLMDRLAAGATVPVTGWLNQQQQNISASVLAFSTRFSNVQERSYHAWIQSLLLTGDLLGRPVDPFSFPAAPNDIDGPDSGVWGAQLDVTRQAMVLELHYEVSPLDGLLALLDGNLLTASNLAAMAADIQLPRWMAKGRRDMVRQREREADDIKSALERYHRQHGRFPTEEEAPSTYKPEYSWQLWQALGSWVVQSGGVLALTMGESQWRFRPMVNAEGSVQWQCELEGRHIPEVADYCQSRNKRN